MTKNDSPYLIDASGFCGEADRVLIPADEAALISILREATQSDTPITIAGAGTGVTGGRVAQGGWAVSLEKFTSLKIHEGRAQVGAGVALKDLHAAAARTGQFYPPDPTETWASMGGTIANNASGARSFRYGDTRRHVLRLRVILANGRILDVGRGDTIDFSVPALPLPDTTKHTAGYALQPDMEWVDLFTGSEGTLGVIVAAEVRLLPSPETLLAGVVFFGSDEDCLAAVESWRGVKQLRMLEYFDQPSLSLLRARYPEIPAASGAALLFEQEGDAELDVWPDRLERAGAMLDASWFATGAADRERFRVFRHALPESVNAIVQSHGCLKMGSDYAVPPARNREMLAYYRQRLEAEFAGQYAIFGHIGDAHVHVNILPRNEVESERAKTLMLDFARRAVELGGTVSAEHGLGKWKRHLLELQYSAEEIQSMREVKTRLDPQWLLGRGNLFLRE
ncbi:MAG: FAD-binding oxidoreductase [Acidobacteriota bacterium]|nr:FAD-binding oxidoreductase [Acidobacteriota bacterium]